MQITHLNKLQTCIYIQTQQFFHKYGRNLSPPGTVHGLAAPLVAPAREGVPGLGQSLTLYRAQVQKATNYTVCVRQYWVVSYLQV